MSLEQSGLASVSIGNNASMLMPQFKGRTETFIERFDLYFTISGIKEEEKRVFVSRSWWGNVRSSEKTHFTVFSRKTKIYGARTTLKNHFDTKGCLIFDRYRFYWRKQASGESLKATFALLKTWQLKIHQSSSIRKGWSKILGSYGDTFKLESVDKKTEILSHSNQEVVARVSRVESSQSHQLSYQVTTIHAVSSTNLPIVRQETGNATLVEKGGTLLLNASQRVIRKEAFATSKVELSAKWKIRVCSVLMYRF